MSDHEDMISAVRASVEQLSKSEGEAPEKTAAPEPTEKVETESAPERARDEQGRFKASDEKPEQPEKSTTEAVKAPEPAPSTAPALKPPTSWSLEAKKAFNDLSPEVQSAVLKREDEFAKGSRQYSDERQRLQSLEGIIAPRRSYYQKYGFKSDVEAINHLFTLSDSMERDPAGTILHLARSANIDLSRLISGGAQQPSQQIQQPQQPQPNLEAQVSEAVAMQFAKMTVQEFEQSPPEHYQEVKPLMQILLEKGQASDLQDAYDRAVWMNPEIRNKMLESQRAEEEQKRVTTQQAKTQRKVQAANASLSGAPHGTPASSPKPATTRGQFGDVAEDVRAAVAALM